MAGPNREEMAKVNGYTGAYGERAWGDIVRDYYQEMLGSSQATEPGEAHRVEHVLAATGEPEASMDPNVSSVNRIV